MIITESQMGFGASNGIRLLDNMYYLSESESQYAPAMVPIVENTNVGKYMIALEDLQEFADSNGISDMGYALQEVCSCNNLDPSYVGFTIQEENVIAYPDMANMVSNLLNEGVTVLAKPINPYDPVCIVGEACLDYDIQYGTNLLEDVFLQEVSRQMLQKAIHNRINKLKQTYTPNAAMTLMNQAAEDKMHDIYNQNPYNTQLIIKKAQKYKDKVDSEFNDAMHDTLTSNNDGESRATKHTYGNLRDLLSRQSKITRKNMRKESGGSDNSNPGTAIVPSHGNSIANVVNNGSGGGSGTGGSGGGSGTGGSGGGSGTGGSGGGSGTGGSGGGSGTGGSGGGSGTGGSGGGSGTGGSGGGSGTGGSGGGSGTGGSSTKPPEVQEMENKLEKFKYESQNKPRQWLSKIIAWLHEKLYNFNAKLKADPEHASWWKKLIGHITRVLETLTRKLHNAVSAKEYEIKAKSENIQKGDTNFQYKK